MRQIVKDLFVSKKIFTMLFIGFLFTILPILIALSTKNYYDEQFYDSKNGFFNYYYSINISKINELDLHKIEEIAGANFENASVITGDMVMDFPEKGLLSVVGLLNDKNWSPPLIKGEKLAPNDSNKIIVGKKIKSQVGTIKLFDKEYQVKGIAGKSSGSEYNYKIYAFLNDLPIEIKQEIERQNAMQLMVRSNQDPMKEINRFISQIKKMNKVAGMKVVNEKEHFEDEKKSRKGVAEVLSYPYKLVMIALINCVIVSYFWIFMKRKEISLRKALGASNGNLFSFIYSQLLICTLLAAGISILIQWFLSKLSETILISTSYNISLSLYHLFISILITIIVSILTSLIPFSYILRIEPAKALKE